MERSKKIVSIFNKQISEFITQSIDVFPNLLKDQEICKLKLSLETTISLTPNIPIQLFYKNVIIPYGMQIDDGDEKFFLDLDIDIENESIKLVKQIYAKTSSSNRKIIWDYIRRLKLLSINYYKVLNE